MKTHKPRSVAFTSVELLVVVALVAVLAGLLLPMRSNRKTHVCRIQCVNNLKQVGFAARGWSIDFGDSRRFPQGVTPESGGTSQYDSAGDVFRHFQAMGNELGSPKILLCPEDKTRRVSALDFTNGFGNQSLSYFIGLDASGDDPSALLSGDRNLSTNESIISWSMLQVTTNSPVRWTRDMHNDAGNVLLADGSAMQLSSQRLRAHIPESTNAVQRILFP